MTAQGAKELSFGGPWRGVQGQLAPRRVPVGSFVEAKNVIMDKGDIIVRPGYTIAARNFRVPFVTISDDLGVNKQAHILDASDPNDVFYVHNSSIATGGGIYKISKGTEATSTLVLAVESPDCLVVDGTDIYYVIEGDGIYKTTTSGGTPTQVVDLSSVSGNIRTLRIDTTVNPKVLWWPVSATTDLIQKAPVDTGTITTVFSQALGGVSTSLAIDPANNRMWYMATSGSTATVFTNNMSGTAHAVHYEFLSVDSGTAIVYNPSQNNIAVLIKPILATSAVYVMPPSGTVTASDVVLIQHGSDYDRTIGTMDIDVPSQRIYLGYLRIGTALNFVGWIPAWSGANRITSAFVWLRSTQAVSGFSNDLVLLQIHSAGWSIINFAIWRPSQALPFETYTVEPGMHVFPDTDARPSIMCNPYRDRDPTWFSNTNQPSFQAKFGRATMAYMGLGLITDKGGVLVSNGEGVYVFNYALGNTVQVVSFSGTPGTVDLSFMGLSLGSFSNTDTAETWRGQMQQNSPLINQVVVTKSGASGLEVFSIEFSGGLSGQDVELLVRTGGTAPNVVISKARSGATEVGDKIYLRTAGLVTPPKPAGSVQSFQSGTISGVYSYKFTWYSAQLGIESPPSERSDYMVVVNGQQIVLTWSIPIHMWFSTVWPSGRIISHLRIYRRRHGNVLSGTEPDGVGASADWQFLVEVPIDGFGSSPTTSYGDATVDEALTVEAVPKYGYPSDKTQFVEVHKGRAFFLDSTPGEQRLSWSNLPHPLTGEFGHEYVNAFSNAVLESTRASDHHPTGLRSFREFLLVFTHKDLFVVNTDLLGQGDLVARLVPGGAGCASHWCVVETEALPELGARLLYPNSLGRVYEFNGSDARVLSDPVIDVARTLDYQTWEHIDQNSLHGDVWYWASAVLDADMKRVIFSSFVDAASPPNTHIQLVFDLLTQTWTTWDIPGWSWFGFREWSGTSGLGKPVIVFCDNNLNLMKLTNQNDDNGTVIDWYLKTGKMDLGHPSIRKVVDRILFMFDLDKQDANPQAAQMFVTPDNGPQVVLPTKNLDRTWPVYASRVDARCRTIQLELAGTFLNGEDVMRLISMTAFYIPLPRTG